MMTRYGMSDQFGMVALETVNNPYLSSDSSLVCSPETSARVDAEVQSLIAAAHDKAVDILKRDRDVMDKLAAYLLEKETITGAEFMDILEKDDAEKAAVTGPGRAAAGRGCPAAAPLDAGAQGGKRMKEGKNRVLAEVWGWVWRLALAVVIAQAVHLMVFQPVSVKGESMTDTLQNGEIMYVSKPEYLLGDPARGDVVGSAITPAARRTSSSVSSACPAMWSRSAPIRCT